MRRFNIASRTLLVALIASPTMIAGCKLIRKTTDSGAMAERLESAPPIRLESLGEHHMLVMQAPNPGWSYRLDKDERERDGWVVFITIRKPDPAFMYPQRIVDKRLLTEVETKHSIRVLARLLEHNEKGSSDQYAPLELETNAQP